MKKHTLILFITLVISVQSLTAQRITLIPNTPTLAPSKTPTATATARVTPTATISTPEREGLFKNFTQQDLSVLTGNVQRPNGAVWHNNKLYAACSGDWTLYELNQDTGATITYIYGVRNAHTLYVETAANGETNFWIPDFDTNNLLLVNRNRAPQPIATNLKGPWGIAPLNDKTFLVTNLLGNSLVSISREGGVVTELATDLRSPTGIAAENGYIYVANNGSSRRAIEWFNSDEIEEDGITLRPLVSGLQSTTGLTLAADGYLYFTYALGTRGVVGRIDPEACRDEGCTNDQVEIVIYTELSAPLAGLTISPEMRLFVHTIFRPEIYWLDLKNT